MGEIRFRWDSLGSEDCWNPLGTLREIRGSDPEYQKNLQIILQTRNQRIGDCCLDDQI